jgi:hypothetical protein
MTSDVVARLTAWVERDEAYRAGRSDEAPGEPLIEDVRAVLDEHRQQSEEIANLRRAVAAARRFIEPIWLAILPELMSTWRMLKPVIEALEAPDASEMPAREAANP